MAQLFTNCVWTYPLKASLKPYRSSYLFCVVDILEEVFNGSLEVEGLDQSRLVEGESVADAAHLNPLRLHPNAQFRVFSDTTLNYVCREGKFASVGLIQIEFNRIHSYLQYA